MKTTAHRAVLESVLLESSVLFFLMLLLLPVKGVVGESNAPSVEFETSHTFVLPILSRLHVLSHWRRAFVGMQTAGRLFANCPVKHPPIFQYQILPTKECYWALEAFFCPCDETDQDSEVQHQDDILEILPTFTEARVRARCVAGDESSVWNAKSSFWSWRAETCL